MAIETKAKSSYTLNANRLAAGAGVLAAAAYFLLFRQASAADDALAWIKKTNPGLSDVEYTALLAYWLTHARIVAAQRQEEEALLAELAAAAAAAEAAAAEAAAEAIANPTPENEAAAAAAAAEAARQFQLWIDTMNATLAGYEAALNEVLPRLASVEQAYNQTFAAYTQIADYIAGRLASTAAQAYVFSGPNLTVDMWGVPWGEFARCTTLGIRNDSISSIRVLKGAKLFLYTDVDFAGREYIFDATHEGITLGDLHYALRNAASSLKCIPSMGDYILDRNTAQGIFNTCYTSLVGVQSEILTLKEAILRFRMVLGVIEYFSVRVDGLLLRIDAIVARLNSQYGI